MLQRTTLLALITLFLLTTWTTDTSAQVNDPKNHLDVYITHAEKDPSELVFTTVMLTDKSDYGVKSVKISPAAGTDDPAITHVMTIELKDRLFGNNEGVLIDQTKTSMVQLDPKSQIEIIVIFDGQFLKKKKRGLVADEQYD